MRIFVTGASGWIGSAVVPELMSAGHEVVGLARSDSSAQAIRSLGAQVLRGDLEDLAVLRNGAIDSDGVIHLGFIHDFSQMAESVRVDAQVIATIGAALEGTNKPFIVASGTPVVASGVATERDNPPWLGPMAGRMANAAAALEWSARAVRSCVVRIPRSVHGQGDRHGLIARLIEIAREKGVSGFVGDGSSRWPAVHILDAAPLFRLAVENAPAGATLHVVGDEGVAARDFATVIGQHLGLPVESRDAEHFGFLGPILGVDMPASSALTQDLLGWRPRHIGLIDDLELGHYFS